jgi:flagellar protein FlaH
MSELILAIDPNQDALARLQEMLEEKEYEVRATQDGSEGLRMAILEKPNLILLDASLVTGEPDISQHLRENANTAEIPIVVLADEEEIDPNRDVDDHLAKPIDPDQLLAAVEAFARDGQRVKKIISSGNSELDDKMGGGLPVGSLTLIEGESGAGKSILTQQIIFGSLQDGFKVTLFTSENTVKSLITQMQSLDLDVLDFLLLGKLRVYPMELSGLGQQAPDILLKALRNCGKCQRVIIVDSLTSVIAQSSPKEVLSFFESCKRLCTGGTTVIAVLHSNAMSGDVARPVRSLCDAHLQLRTEQDGQRLIKTLEVSKVRGASNVTGAIVSFDVEPGWGMRVVPVSKARG